METAQYYRHSGDIPPAALFAGVVVGAIAAALGGVAYGFADEYVNFIYIRIIMTIGFGLLLGWAPAQAMVKAKARNTAVIVIIAAACAAAGYYICWAGWLCALYLHVDHPIPFMKLLTSPFWMVRIIVRLNAVGVWGMSEDSPFNGIFLAAIWLLEAGIIFGSAIVTAGRVARRGAFCEDCGQWAAGPRTIAATAPVDRDELRQKLESGSFDFVPRLARFSAAAGNYLQWDAWQCAGCNDFNTLSVTSVTVARDKRGRAQKRRKIFVDKLLISTQDLALLEAKPAPPAPAAVPLPPIPKQAAEAPAPAPEPPPEIPPPPPRNQSLLDI